MCMMCYDVCVCVYSLIDFYNARLRCFVRTRTHTAAAASSAAVQPEIFH